eukprot:TRINITY_DN12878_c0_g1_i4.p1 TRINITY_DN12878_c0_g1~~TRINITY_DN12878_c0_g1_i4.p1  ORF type:complete len:210 (-),score=63.69 TRINITY_DN12878_c0_g1_i4:39-668(-)
MLHRGSVTLELSMEETLKERALSSAAEEVTLARSRSIDQQVLAAAEFGAELLVERGIIREILLAGEFEKAEEYIKGKFPSIWNEDKNVRVSIWALQFIELLRRADTKAAIDFAREHFTKETEGGHFITFDPNGYASALEIDEVFGLLCYETIEESSMKHLFLPMQREAVSDYVSNKILKMRDMKDVTSIEKILKPVSYTHLTLPTICSV